MVQATYDGEAPTYDNEADYPAALQQVFVRRLVETCPEGGLVLDAPCGTGRYFELVIEAGRRVVGIDQSVGMLAIAEARGLAEAVHLVGLQELMFNRVFDGAMTIDAMENIPPEDWPLVLTNLHLAVRTGGHLYLTVEETDEASIDAALVEAKDHGWPAVRGEVVEGDTAGYHYYPGRPQVMSWLADEGLELVDEAFDQQEGWGYHHLLLRS